MMSKAQEKELLEQLREAVHGNEGDMYLKSFITKDLIAWVTIQIDNDLSCDIFGVLADTRKQSMDAGAACAQAENAAKAQAKAAEAQIAEVERAAAAQVKRLNDVIEKLDAHQKDQAGTRRYSSFGN